MYHEYSKYGKISVGCGVASALGLLSYEAYRTYAAISTLVDTRVLEIDRKRPDYIYIKHHIYRQSVREQQQQNRPGSHNHLINVIVQPFGKWWKTLKHSVAWRLLSIAQRGDRIERLKAIRQLALIDHLKDWDFQHLAQLCDYRTAISLARSDGDPRWFLPPRQYGMQKPSRDVLMEVRTMIECLMPSPCAEYALERTFFAALIKEPDGDEISYQMSPSRFEYDQLKQALSALVHLTADQGHCQRLIDSGGLLSLIEVEKLYRDDIDMKLLVSRVIANLSTCPEREYDFFASGWLSILSRWKRDVDMRMQVVADLTLSNLDRDDPHSFRYEPKLYPLHPRGRMRSKPNLDVVFIHGLLGGVFVTWRQKDLKPQAASLLEGIAPYQDELLTFQDAPRKPDRLISDTATKELIQALQEDEPLGAEWSVVYPDLPVAADEVSAPDTPEGTYSIAGNRWLQEPLDADPSSSRSFCWPMEWLPKDFPKIRVLGLNYESSLSQWAATTCPCEKNDGKLHNRASEFLQKLVAANVGQDRPVVWVGHSMGGLLIKSIIVQAMASDDPVVRRIGENSRVIMFLGTPHRGSGVAKLKQHTSALVWPSVEVRELEENSKQLLQLHKTFLKLIEGFQRKPEIVSICEGRPTVLTSFKFPFHIVPEGSARIDEGDFYLTTEDHLNLSKPICRQSFLYQRLITAIRRAIKDSGTDAVQNGGMLSQPSSGATPVEVTSSGKQHSTASSNFQTFVQQLDNLLNNFI